MKLFVSEKFDRELKKLLKKNPKYNKRINKCVKLMKNDLNYPSLRLHKLSGSKNYSVSVDMSIKIIIHFWRKKIFLLRIGKHEEVY
ncbi:plasmid stabilization protein [Patescibacteria group bacterium]|nr:plasmid stabilization protein [Patescibacteria group bacterium]MCG2702598.1 plasmid stabilization protein [Candidatus Parcubacteria bacterium]MBU4210614.1 plasmid stabilization protein [Patescibacteria group bacterium]MBU4265508.1 plasmid stabilization protein [Patescibacteria group bacterium]MBU4390558.1 plasmid stabilization protein [Patescibacteria group bacterium]